MTLPIHYFQWQSSCSGYRTRVPHFSRNRTCRRIGGHHQLTCMVCEPSPLKRRGRYTYFMHRLGSPGLCRDCRIRCAPTWQSTHQSEPRSALPLVPLHHRGKSGRKWHRIDEGIAAEAFGIDDGTGMALIDQASVWKYFDLDGDDNISMGEWELAREAAKQQVMDEHRITRLRHGTQLLRYPAGHLYLIANRMPEQLAAHANATGYGLSWALLSVLASLPRACGKIKLRKAALVPIL